MGEAYLIGRILIYLTVAFLAVKYNSIRHPFDKYIIAYVGLSAFTDLLDKTVIGDNIELYSIYNLSLVILLSVIIYKNTDNALLPIILSVVQVVCTIVAFSTEFYFNLIVFEQVFQSEYGWLNTNQSTQLELLASLINIVLVFYWMYKFVSEDGVRDNSKFLLYSFAFLTHFGLSFILKIFDRLLYENREDFIVTSYIVLISSFFIEHILIILGLKWKQ